MLIKKITLINKLGLHARASMHLVNTASRYQSEIKITFQNKTINAKSIMNIIILAAPFGSELEFTISGEDEAEAWAAIEKLIQQRFGEEE